jgi:molecular chaperone DnaJ
MADSNHYETLKVNPNASQAEIKQAYRRLVKLFHPDSLQNTANHEEIVRINAAYEVLGDVQSRQSYDRQQQQRTQVSSRNRQQRTQTAGQQHEATRQRVRNADEQIQEWLRLVYQPVHRLLGRIIRSLQEQIDNLAADPFDDELLEEFQDYLQDCRNYLKQAQVAFRSQPNPPELASAAAGLYYCLNQIADGLDELGYFPLNYDDRYLHTGQEMFRIARGLYREVREAVQAYA